MRIVHKSLLLWWHWATEIQSRLCIGRRCTSLSNDKKANVRNMWNNGARVNGPWVTTLIPWSRGSAKLALWSTPTNGQRTRPWLQKVFSIIWSTINKITFTRQVELTGRQLSSHGWTRKFPYWRRREECSCNSCEVIWATTAGKWN